MSVQAVTQWVADRKSGLRRLGLLVALVIFAGGTVLAFQAIPDLLERFEAWPFALLVLLAAPVIVALGTIEFQLLARYSGAQITARTALESTLHASAANMLPLPGGLLVRMAVLKSHGTGYGFGMLLMLLSLVMWGSMAFVYAGLWLLVTSNLHTAAAFIGVGLLGGALSSVVAWRMKPDWRLTATIFAVRLVGLPLAALRVMLALWAVGENIGFAESSVYVVASFIGSAVMIVPSGLGVVEASMAALSPIVGVEPAMGFIGGAVIRVALMMGMAALVLAALLLVRKPFDDLLPRK